MKKIVLISLAVFAALFVLITAIKFKPEAAELKQEDSAHTRREKEKVIRFWEYFRMATDYRIDQQWEKAAEYYRRSLELNDRHEDGLYYLGNMYLELSRYKEAEACWLKLAEVNPGNSRAFLQLGTLYLSSEAFFDIDKAEDACRKSLKINKEESGPVLLLGEVYLIRGQLQDAASCFDAVTASHFKSVEAFFLGGYVAWKKGNLKKGRSLFDQAVKYAKPVDKKPEKVIGEGDTKQGRSFGNVTSKSVFRKFMAELPGIRPEQSGQALGNAYKRLDAFLTELRKGIH